MNPLLVKYGPTALLVLFAGGFWLEHDWEEQQKGALKERLHTLTLTNDSLVKAGKQQQVVYHVDTVTLTKKLVQHDTVLARYDHYLHDTVAVPVAVVREIVRADSEAIRACLVVKSQCERMNENLSARLTLTEKERDAYRKTVPSGFRRTVWLGRDLLIGFGVGYLVGKR